MARWSAQWWKLSKNTAASNGSSATNSSMSPWATVIRPGPSQRCAMSRQNFSSSSTAVTSIPVATRSRVRLPQPGPNSTTRRVPRSAGTASARHSSRWPRADQIAADQCQRAGLVRKRPLQGGRQVEGGRLVLGVVAGPARDRAVEVPGPLPVGGGEGIVGRLRRQRQHHPVEQGARVVGGGAHQRRRLRQHGVELVQRDRAGAWPPQRRADGTPQPRRERVDRLRAQAHDGARRFAHEVRALAVVVVLSRPRACSGRSGTRRRSWRSLR